MPYSDLIGEHESIRAVRELVARVAASPVRQVLLYGETGTGKGLVARLIHRLSPRAASPFVDVNCAAIPATLMESELFGHERGAFTGAQGAKPGLIEAAQGGTLFLDEIREMDLQLQAKLLTLLDTHEFRRLGAVKPTRVDVRFIASTNRILLSEVKAGRFRDDLYWRLQVVAVNIPPLRERGDDVILLAEAFLRQHGSRAGRVIRGLEPRVAEIFRRYSWPGNVRELENAIRTAVVLHDGDLLEAAMLPAQVRRGGGRATPPAPAPAPAVEPAEGSRLIRPLAEVEREAIERAIALCGGNIAKAAAHLGVSPSTIYRKRASWGDGPAAGLSEVAE